MDFPRWIDPELIERCEKSWNAADYENAVFCAFKVLETRAGAISTRTIGLQGVKLFDCLLAPGSGCLQVSSNKGEQEGIHQTFRGLYLWLRNPSGHRFANLVWGQAFELLCFVDFLLSSLGASQRKEAVVDSPVGRYLLADVDGDGAPEKLILTEREVNGKRQSQLLVLDRVGAHLKQSVLLAEHMRLSFLTIKAKDLNGDGILEIIVSAPGGAHSESMFIFRWDGSSYQCVGEFLSDAPTIEIKDLDADGLAEVIAKGRDYRGDPITQSVYKVYHWIEGKFELVQASRPDLAR